MHILIKYKNDFVVAEYKRAKNLAYSAGIYTITTAENTTVNYSEEACYVFLLIN